MKYRIISLLVTLSLLLCCVPVLGVEVKAADTEMYLYNGVELPALPSSIYVHHFIVQDNQNEDIFLYSVNGGGILYGSNFAGYYYYRYLESSHSQYCYQLVSGLWKLVESDSGLDSTYLISHSSSGTTSYNVTLLWSSLDYTDQAGNLVAGSAPVPVGGDSGSTDSYVTSIDLSRTSTSCYAGTDIAIGIDVTGTGEYDESCTCTVSGGTSSGTYVELDTTYDTPNLWYLYVGADETAESLTITATSVQDPSISATHTVTVEELSSPPEVPTLTGNVPTDPIVVNVGDAVPTLRVIAEVSDGGTLSYQWYQTVDGTSTQITGATSSQYTPTTTQAGEFYYFCRVTNTTENGSSYVDSGSAWVTVSEAATTDPTSGDSSGDGSSSDSGEDLSDVLDQKEQEAEAEGNAAADEVIALIPNESEGLLEGLNVLVSVLTYEGTTSVLTMPAIKIPAINGLFSEITVLEEQELDFEYFIGLMPEVIMILVRALFDIAIVVYCWKEFQDLVASMVNGFSGVNKEMED